MKTTKLQLAETAIRLFNEYGYEKTSVERICKECNLTRAGFYHHFKAKEEIFFEYFSSIRSRAFSMLSEILRITSPLEQLWTFFDVTLGISEQALSPETIKQVLFLDLESDSLYITPYVLEKEQFSEYRDILYTIIARGQKSGEIRMNSAPENMVYSFLSGATGITLSWAISDGEFDCKTEIRRFFLTIFASAPPSADRA